MVPPLLPGTKLALDGFKLSLPLLPGTLLPFFGHGNCRLELLLQEGDGNGNDGALVIGGGVRQQQVDSPRAVSLEFDN